MRLHLLATVIGSLLAASETALTTLPGAAPAMAPATGASAQPSGPVAGPMAGAANSSTDASKVVSALGCMNAMLDQATGACLEASSEPELGKLYPMSSDLFVTSEGFVGIGTTQPTYGLDVTNRWLGTGNITSHGEMKTLGSLQVYGEFEVHNGMTANYVNAAGLKVDGSGAPDIEVTTTTDATISLYADTDNSNEFDHATIYFFQDGGAVQSFIGFGHGTNGFYIENSYDFAETYFDQSDGSGFGNDWEFSNGTDTEARITDGGDLNLDGNVSSPAADLAEYYPTAEAVEPGDVVAFAAGGMQLVRTGHPDAGPVAGIVSSYPGFVLGASNTDEESGAVPAPVLDEGERFLGLDARSELRIDRLVLHEIEVNQRAPLALAGRVPCKVSAENGAIRAGDRLTLATVPGHAAKSVGAGPLVGIALQPWDFGSGEILVFVERGYDAPDRTAEIRELRAELAGLRADLHRLEVAR